MVIAYLQKENQNQFSGFGKCILSNFTASKFNLTNFKNEAITLTSGEQIS